MQTSSFRYLFLAGIMLVGATLYALVSETHAATDGGPRWPSTEATYSADGWAGGPLSPQHSSNNTDLVTRVFRNASGTEATLTLVTNQAPKLYGAGAEVPLLGNGFTVSTPSTDVVPTGNGVSALLAKRADQQWLVMYAYGERRGLLGNGILPWSLAITDGMLGRQNDYYKMYLMARLDTLDPTQAANVANLAQTLFPRIAAWYAA